MKKLLQINTVINSGSTGRIAEDIGQLVKKLGWESYIAYGRNPRPSQSKLIRIGNDWDVKLHAIKTRLFDNHCFSSKRATRKLIDEIENIKPDIIHLHNLHGYYVNIELLFNYLAFINTPVIWTLHDCWPITGHCVYFDYIRCDKWETGCDHCPQKNTYPSSFFLDRSKINYQLKKELFTSLDRLTIVPVSNWLGNIVRESFLSKYPVQVIHNGIDTSVFEPQNNYNFRDKYNLKGRFIILGVANIWSTRKGLSDFIELSKQMDPEYQIVLVGLNKSQIKHLPKNIIGISRTENLKQLAELYSTADLFLNLTYEDNFPTTNIESLACGTPILTYNTGGSIEAVSPDTGFIVGKGDLSGVINIMRVLKEKGEKFYSKACSIRAVNFFNKDDRFLEYIKLYETVLKR